MSSLPEEWEDEMEDTEIFMVDDEKQLKKIMIECYISGKNDFQLKFSKFSQELHETLKEILKTLPGFEIYHMSPRIIFIKDLGDHESLKGLNHELCQKRLKALKHTIESGLK